MTSWRQLLRHERMKDRLAGRDVAELWSGRSAHGIVATAHWAATAAGIELLEAGGNAVDAAVGAGFALGVAEPAGSGLGGMAHLVVHLAPARRTLALVGPCRVPARVDADRVAQGEELSGYTTAAIPTHPAVMDHALRLYGTMPLGEVLAPAIRLAVDGYPVSPFQRHLTEMVREPLAACTAARFYLDAQGQPLAPGAWLRQPVLAATLRHLADAGVADFYRGDIARSIERDMVAHDGFVRADDLREISPPIECDPLMAEVLHGTAYALPAPGGGPTLLQQLLLLDRVGGLSGPPDSARAAVLLASIGRRAEADRKRRPAVPVDETGQPAPKVLTRAALRRAAAVLCGEGSGGSETSHVSVMDRWGNAVALTQSINYAYGSKCAAADLGFPYNCYLGDFNRRRSGHPYYLRPGAAARSNATPTIVLREGRPVVAIGAAGSRRMLAALFQVLVRLEHQGPYQAVAAPRLFCDAAGQVSLEADRFAKAVLKHLRRRGFKVHRWEPWSFMAGAVQVAVADDAGFEAAADPRRDGAAGGPDH